MVLNYTQERPLAADATELFLHRWVPSQTKPIGEVLVLHGYMEHGGRYQELGHALGEKGLATSALDYRGHGRATGDRGHVVDFYNYFLDIEAGLKALDPQLPHFILGHSFGALLALDYVNSRHPLAVKGVVVTNPFLDLAAPPPKLKLKAGQWISRFMPSFKMPSDVSADDLSHEPAVGIDYQQDPLVFNKASVGWFFQTREAQSRVQAIHVFPLPLLYVYSDADAIASPAANRELSASVQCSDLEVMLRTGEFHEVLNETKRTELFAHIIDWISARL
jgi:alpha-beta hydrolase superfamily lysophospholipase